MKTVGELIEELQKHDPTAPVDVLIIADQGTEDMRGYHCPWIGNGVNVATAEVGGRKVSFVTLNAVAPSSVARPGGD